jgi:ribosomal protein S18 acetylase RimI-like enzyme
VFSTRAIRRDQFEDWIAIGLDDPANERMADRIRDAWADGSGGPELTFVAQNENGMPVGRVAFTYGPVAEAMPDVHEALALGLWLSWDEPEAVDIGRRLIVDNLPALPESVIALDAYANPEYMTAGDVRRSVFEAAGLPLFQEKEGFLWMPESSPPPARDPRLTYRSVTETGRALYGETMSRATEGSLDRQDRYYAALVGRDGWGPEMLNFLTNADASGWLLAYDSGGDVAGYVAIGAFGDEKRGTIMHVGVPPEHRGNGYIVELLLAGNEAAVKRGFETVVSDVDVENLPMLAAMERAGHHAAATPWHVHHYRLALRA